jgi:hypothetical protein
MPDASKLVMGQASAVPPLSLLQVPPVEHGMVLIWVYSATRRLTSCHSILACPADKKQASTAKHYRPVAR